VHQYSNHQDSVTIWQYLQPLLQVFPFDSLVQLLPMELGQIWEDLLEYQIK
jgi:hypothetical protein